MHDKGKIIIIMALVVAITMITNIYALDIDNEKQQLNSVNNKIDKIQNNKRENEAKQKSLQNEIKSIEKELIDLESKIDNTNSDISNLREQIDLTQIELKSAESKIDSKNDTLNSRLRVMYKSGQVGYLEVLLDSADIFDFISRLDMIKKIFMHDMDLLKTYKEQKEIIEQKKDSLENQNLQLQNLILSMQNNQEKLQVSRGKIERAKGKLIADYKILDAEEDKFNKLAKDLEKEIRAKQSNEKYVGGAMAWPTPGFTQITSPFGYRIHPVLKTKKFHTGMDIGLPAGKNVVAVQDGRVITSGWLGGYGRTVMIDHGGGIVTLYAHNSQLLVKEGKRVKQGQIISKSGSSGLATGPNLHFEVRENGKYMNPLDYLRK